MTAIQRIKLLSQFSCLGDRCEDTCCKGWSMQLDEQTLELYKKEAPELLDAVEAAQEVPWIMRKDPATGVCVKLENGLCGIHKQYGERFLGDACYFYPRVTRQLGDAVVMSAAMSCPEIVRLALATEDAGTMEAAVTDRLPASIKNYLPQGVAPAEALAVHHAFLSVVREEESAEYSFLRILNVSRFLERIERNSWPQGVPFYLKNAETQLVPAQPHPADPFNLLHALTGLIVASRKPPSDRLRQTVADMEQALAVRLDWEQILIHTSEQSLPAYQAMQARWRSEGAAYYAPILRRWLRMQLSLSCFPHGGLGGNLQERAIIIGVRLATVKLALMSGATIHGADMPQEQVVRIIQSLSRFLDHLADAEFSLRIYRETGWDQENRLRGLLDV